MASFIRPNRTEVNRTFPWLGFTIRTGTAPAWFEVAIATDPSLFDAEAKSRRTAESFYSTRAAGPLPAPSGEAVWIVPPAVLARFAGQPKIYYALATFRSADRQGPEIVRVAPAAAPAISLSRSFTGVTRRLAGVGGRSSDTGPDYGSATVSPSLEWAGDTYVATAVQPAAPAGGNGAAAHASAVPFEYHDGYGPLPQEPPAHEQAAHALGDAVDCYWNDVELVPQPSGYSCWAAAAAMLVGWRDRVSINPSEFWAGSGYWSRYRNSGLSTNDNDEFAQAWGLEIEPPQDYSVDGFRRLLEAKGPLWVGRHPTGNRPNMGHAVCVIGLTGDGSPDSTYVHWHDPWPPGTGSANRSATYTQFMQEFDDFISVDPTGRVNNQILHASGTDGRSPGRFSSAQSFGVARSLGTFDSPPVTKTHESSGDIDLYLEQWDGMKYPPGVTGGGAATSAKRFTIEGPRYAAVGVDNIYADVDVDFQYDGRGVGKVAMRQGSHSDAVFKGLSVTAHVADDARTFVGPSGQTFAGLRITIDYTMTQTISDDVQAQIDVMIYGSGDYDVRYRSVQGSFDHMPTDVVSGVRPATTPARAQAVAMEGEGGGAAGIGGQAVGSIAGVVVQRMIENVGDLTIAHESWNGMRYPSGVTRGNVAATPKSITLQGPRYNAFYVDAIYCDLAVDFEFDGRGIGKVAMRAGARSDAVGKGLDIQAHIVDDARTFTGGSSGGQTFAGIRITLEYSFTQTVSDDIVVHADVMLYGNGDYDVHYHLIQGEVDHMPADVTSGVRPTNQPAVPQPASLGAAGDIARDVAGQVAEKVAGYYIDRLLSDSDNIESSLDQWPRSSDRSGPAAKKFPFDDPGRAGAGATQHRTMTVASPKTSLQYIDDILCDLEFSWDYNGNWITNVDVVRGARNGPGISGGTLHVTAHLDDVPGAFSHGTDGPFAALRYNVAWEYHRSLHDDIVVHATVLLYGDGGWSVAYRRLQGTVDEMPADRYDVVGSLPQPAQAAALGAEDILKSIGGFIVERFDPREDGIDATLDKWPRGDQRGPAARKYPFDDPREAGSGGTRRANVTVQSPHTSSSNYCDLAVSWDYDGRSLTNVDITTGDAHGVNFLERLDFKYTVSARIEDIAGAFADAENNPPCAGLRILIEWREHRPIKDNTLVLGTLTIFGNGGYMLSYDYKSGDLENWTVIGSDHFHPAMRPVGRPPQAQSLEAASVTRSSETRGPVRFDLDQLSGVRQPPGHANGAGPMQTATVAVVGPRASTMPGLDETYGDCEVSFEYDGHSVGNVHVRPTAAAGTAPLRVLASINGDPDPYVMPGGADPFVAVPLDFGYEFGSAPPAATSLVLYGNGTHDIHYRWSRG